MTRKGHPVPAALMLALTWLALVAGAAGDPVYGGRTLAECRADLQSRLAEARVQAIVAIEHFGKQGVSALADALTDDPAYRVRYHAAAALLRLGPAAQEALPALVQALSDEGPEDEASLPSLVIREIGRLGTSAAVRAVAQGLLDASPAVRRGAAAALGRIGRPAAPAIPAIAHNLGDPDASVRSAAADALADIDPAAAARALGERASPTAVPALVQTLVDGDPRIRAESAGALGWLGSAGQSGVPALVRVLADPEVPVRRQAAVALGRMGPAAAGAIPALTRVLHDVEPVRAAAAVALARIGSVTELALAEAFDDTERRAHTPAAEAWGRPAPGLAEHGARIAGAHGTQGAR